MAENIEDDGHLTSQGRVNPRGALEDGRRAQALGDPRHTEW